MSRSSTQGRIRVAGVAMAVSALVATGAVSGPASAATHAHVTYLAEGHAASDRHYKPKAITLSGDSTLFLKDANWHVWSNKTASGSVRSGWNDCTPDCARGTVHWYLAKATLSKPRLICGRHFFTEITFHFTHGRPHGIPQDDVYDTTPAGAC